MYSLPRYIPSLPTEKERCSLQGKSLQGTHGGGEDAGHREKGNVGQRAESPAPPPEGHVARGPGANRSSWLFKRSQNFQERKKKNYLTFQLGKTIEHFITTIWTK